jgi:hypothetical protein
MLRGVKCTHSALASIWGSSRWRRSMFSLVVFGGVVAFVLVSETVDGQPSLRPFSGWIAVLNPTQQASGDQVELTASALVPGAKGANPWLRYSVDVCGTTPFEGVLLIGGDARLLPINGQVEVEGPTSRSRNVIHEEDVSFGLSPEPVELLLGYVQVVPLAFSYVPPCVEAFPSRPPGHFHGYAEVVSGSARGPVQRDWTAPDSLWEGPRTSQVWPLIGALPEVSRERLGVFQADTGLHGSWSRPAMEYNGVNVSTLTGRASTELIRPEPRDTSELSWRDPEPIEPIARVVNTDALAGWQQKLIFATIWLAISGSLAAAALWRWTDPRDRRTAARMAQDAVPTPAPPPSRTTPTRGSLHASAAFILAALVLWLRHLRKRYLSMYGESHD